MCDQTEVIYSPNDVVWVKLGPVWWPGRVCGEDEIPPEIMKDLRKKPIAIVKFFQEDSFEYVKSLSNIYHYHCARKNEFIKKGLDMLRSKNRGAPSNMKLFPEDIVRAEHLTHGNTAILQNDMFLPEEKPAYTDLFTSNKKLPKKVKPEVKKKQSPDKQNTPRLITHPRFLQLSSGQNTDYEVRERKQMPVRAECDEEDTSPPPLYTCTECEYTTTRLNVIVWHNKSHLQNYVSPKLSGKATKRKSTVSLKLKESSLSDSPSVEPKADDAEVVSAAKIPKTNGTLKISPSPKTRGRKKRSIAAEKTPVQSTPLTKEANSTSAARIPAQKSRRGSAHKGDEIHKSLLEDWLEDDIESEEPAVYENSAAGDTSGENMAIRNDSTSKSCFDFDDSEDHLVIDKSKFKPGRKIPRLLNKSAPLKIAADDVVAMPDSTGALEVDENVVDPKPKYQSGVEECMDSESSLCGYQTSQLQEMGVDNEIEIKTEEMPVNEVVIESVPPKKSRRNRKTEAKSSDATELHDQVDKLLNEISKAPAKLPDIPRSHKKAQLKAYQQQAEAEEAARKAAAEAEVAHKAIAEAEVAQEATSTSDVSQSVAIKIEDAQIQVAEVEAASIIATKAEAFQNVVEENAVSQKEDDLKMVATQQYVKEEVASDFHPETIDTDVSNICPVTNESVESSISIGASVTVAEDETGNEQSSLLSPVEVSSEMLVVKNTVTEAVGVNSTAVDGKVAVDASFYHLPQAPSSAADAARAGDLPAITDVTTPANLATACKTSNATPTLLSSKPKMRVIASANYEQLVNQLTASASHVSPSKTTPEPLKAMTTDMANCKKLMCNLSPSKIMVSNRPSSGSQPKFILLNVSPSSTSTATATAATIVSTPVSRSISFSNATTFRVTPTILQKSAAAQKTTAILTKSPRKCIFLNTGSLQLCKLQSQIVLPEVVANAQPQIPSNADSNIATLATNSKGNCFSNTTDQTINHNFNVDSSGNLVQVNESPSKEKDILAKALENTDGLQREMALSEAATNSVLDVYSIAQNTEMASKMEAMHANQPPNVTSIMSTYEAPSRVASAVNVVAETSNEKSEGEYLT